jgi:hypothetical protein
MKETFYLRHDYNARNDERIIKLRRKYPDGAGYGIYWMVIEKLAESSEGRIELASMDDLAFDLHLDSKRIEDVIRSYKLFEIDKKYFWSNRLLGDLAERESKSKQAILANKIRWDRERKKLQTESGRTPRKGEERKGEERKGKKKSDKEINKKLIFKRFPNLLEDEYSNYLTEIQAWCNDKGDGQVTTSRVINWIKRDPPKNKVKRKIWDGKAGWEV